MPAEDEGSGGEFGAGFGGGDEGFEDGLWWCGGCHGGASPAWLGWMFSASMECISGEDSMADGLGFGSEGN